MPNSTAFRLYVPATGRWQLVKGPLLMVVAILVIELASLLGLAIPNPGAIYLLFIVYAAFSGGLASGLISAAITLLFALYSFAIPGHPFSYTNEQLTRLVVIALTSPAMALLVGILKRRADSSAGQALRAQELQMSLQAERKYGAELQEANRLKEESLLREQSARTEAEMAQRRLSALAGARDRALAEAELLNAIARAAAGEDDLGRILAAALDHLARIVRFTGGSIAVIEERDLVIKTAVGPFASTAIGQRMPHGPQRSWQVIDTAEPYMCNDLQAAGVKVQGAQTASPLRSYLAVPLIWRGNAFGLLEVDSTEPNVFNDGDLKLMQAVAAVLSGPIELARRYAGQVQARQRVEQLAAENARLYREAQEAIHARDQFLSIASHELKTPLTSMLGYAELLRRRASRDGTLPERDQRALDVIIGQIERLNKLVVEMLDLSRIETGQFSIEHGPVDLTALARRVVAETQPALEQHTIALSSPDEPLIVDGDELRLEQVVHNLVGNAIKYSPAGGPIAVRVERRGEVAVVAVVDHGIGIPAESLPRLFQRFFRAHNVEAEQIGGLGLGLYVVKEIVALHGGEVDVSSRQGEGSTFTISIPLLKEDE